MWVDRSCRVRIHEMARNYEVEDTRTVRSRTARSAQKKSTVSPARRLCRKRSTKSRLAQMSRCVNVVNIVREGEPDPQSGPPKGCVSLPFDSVYGPGERKGRLTALARKWMVVATGKSDPRNARPEQ